MDVAYAGESDGYGVMLIEANAIAPTGTSGVIGLVPGRPLQHKIFYLYRQPPSLFYQDNMNNHM